MTPPLNPSGLTVRRLLCVLAAVVGLVLPGALQAQAGMGSISGRVQNVGNAKNLNNVRITVEGTNHVTFTNEYGEYRLNDVPAGEVRVQAFYTGLDSEVSTVTVTAGQAVTLDFNLSSRERYGDDKTVKLDTFVVAASREFEGNAIATNEQRFSPNIKNVVAADAFGDVTEGNVGEFLKYLPGISVDYVAADVRTVSVRGFADTFTNVSVDGMRITSSVSGTAARAFEFEQISINNVARIEVVKVPTPDTPADSLGGNINMVSKNAFERRGVEFNYRAYLSANNEDTNLFSKTAGPGNKQTYKVLPGFDFDLAIPFSKTFGIVITGLSSNQFNEQHRWQPTWNYAQAGATQDNPYLQQLQMQDGPKNTYRDSLSAKADWKISDDQVVSLMVQNNYYAAFFGNRNINFNLGTNPVPTPATGSPLSWGPDFVNSATGRASVTQSGSFRNKNGDTLAAALTYTRNGRFWDINAGLHGAQSRLWYRDLSDGQFSAFSTSLQGVSQVRVSGIAYPGFDWVAYRADGSSIDYNNLNNYRVTTTRSQPIDGLATMKGGFVDVKRDFDTVSFPFAIKAGIAGREEVRDNRRYQTDYTYLGPDLTANTADDNAVQFIDTAYSTESPYWGKKPIQWGDPYLMGALFKAHPEYFRDGTGATATGVQSEIFRISNSQRISEKVSAAYVQAELKLFNNKLGIVTGVRYEKTEDSGVGAKIDPDAPFVRNADGTFLDGDPVTAGLQRVRKTAAGAAGSLQEVGVIYTERAFHNSNSYDSYNPSFHATYQLKDNLQFRFSYARTFGRPDYTDIIPSATIDENENAIFTPGSSPGTITLTNTGLKPWKANNYDVSLEYYFKRGGVASVGAFQKNLQDFWGTFNAPLTAAQATALGLDPIYAGWTAITKTNVGDAKITGLEVNFQHTLDFIPGWGRYFSINANATKLHLTGPNGTDFRRFIPETANFSLSFNHKPVTIRVTYNYRGRQLVQSIANAQSDVAGTPAGSGGFSQYYAARYNLDTNFTYTYSKRLQFFFNARNITNVPQNLEQYSANSAVYAHGSRSEEFGIQLAAGLKGSF